MRTTITARALPTCYSRPEQVEITIAGVAHVVDVGCDRDDWQLPDCDDAIAHLVIDAIDAAIERELARDEYPATRLERTWARRAA